MSSQKAKKDNAKRKEKEEKDRKAKDRAVSDILSSVSHSTYLPYSGAICLFPRLSPKVSRLHVFSCFVPALGATHDGGCLFSRAKVHWLRFPALYTVRLFFRFWNSRPSHQLRTFPRPRRLVESTSFLSKWDRLNVFPPWILLWLLVLFCCWAYHSSYISTCLFVGERKREEKAHGGRENKEKTNGGHECRFVLDFSLVNEMF